MAAHINIRGAHLVFGIGCYPFKMIRNPSKRLWCRCPIFKAQLHRINSLQRHQLVRRGIDDSPFRFAGQDRILSAAHNVAAVTAHLIRLLRPGFQCYILQHPWPPDKIHLCLYCQPKKILLGHRAQSHADLLRVEGSDIHKQPKGLSVAQLPAGIADAGADLPPHLILFHHRCHPFRVPCKIHCNLLY